MEKIDYATHEKPTDFMKFEQGENTVRIVSDGFLARKHQFRTGDRFISMPCEGANCPHCEKGSEAKVRYLWVVLNRLNEQVRIMEVGVMIGEAICKIGKAVDVRTIDLVVSRKGQGRNTKYEVEKAKESAPVSPEVKQDILEKMPYLMKKYLS